MGSSGSYIGPISPGIGSGFTGGVFHRLFFALSTSIIGIRIVIAAVNDGLP
jgi:hypothetical protein